uniref:Uncharacterized protein n=1 Tax=Magallana gigas TaxID=29159 RepID=A0A8W8N5D4_MAGGI|nr:uncharacterized protein LOC105341385 [Crassostrea gigas]
MQMPIHNLSTTISTGTTGKSDPSSSTFDLGHITTLCLFVLLLFNITFTLYFYISWKRRQDIRHRQYMDEKQPYKPCKPEIVPASSTEHIYESVRSSACSIVVQSRDKRQSIRWNTLTTLFDLNSKDVQNILKNLEPENESSV